MAKLLPSFLKINSVQNGAIAYGLTCATTLDEVKEILNRLVLGQFSPISAENILMSFSKSGLTSLVLADFMETNFKPITSILSFTSLRSILYNLSLSPKSSKVKQASTQFQIDVGKIALDTDFAHRESKIHFESLIKNLNLF